MNNITINCTSKEDVVYYTERASAAIKEKGVMPFLTTNVVLQEIYLFVNINQVATFRIKSEGLLITIEANSIENTTGRYL